MSHPSPAVTRPRSWFVFSLMLFVVSTSLPAQVSETVDVRVIQIPVVVARNATPVQGLTQADFEVIVNGQKQPIAYFDVLEFKGSAIPAADAPAPALPAAATPDLAQRRLTMLVFDLGNSSVGEMKRSREKVAAFVHAASPDDFFAVATYTRGGSVQYVIPFTRDRAAVVRAAATLVPSDAQDALALAISKEERAALASLNRLAPPTADTERAYDLDFERALGEIEERQARSEKPTAPLLSRYSRDQEWRDRSAATNWALALGDVAEEVGRLEGVKQVLLFSEGIALHRLNEVQFGPDAERMHERYRRSGVVLNVVDIGGLRAEGNNAGSRGFDLKFGSGSRSDTPRVLFHAALGTGGTVMHGSSTETSLRRFFDTRRVTYLLGIRPPSGELDSNVIQVKVKNQPRLTEVFYRRGYSKGNALDDVSGFMLADMIMNDIRRSDVTVDLRVQQKPELVVEVGVPSEELLAHSFAGNVTVDFFVYAFDPAGAIVGSKYRRMRLETEKARATLKGAQLVRRETFDLPSGAYTVKALVHVVGRGLIGFESRSVASPVKQAMR